VASLSLWVTIVAIDFTAVATALPTIATTFELDPVRAQWVLLAYRFPLIGLLLPAGRWAEGANLRQAFAVGVVGFAVASMLTATAPTFETLLGARALQGTFGAIIGALFLAIVSEVAKPTERGRVVGVTLTSGALGAIAGPALGGVLVMTLSWRGVFLLNLPICMLALLIAWRAIPSRGSFNQLRAPLLAEVALTLAAALSVFLALSSAASAGWDTAGTLLLVPAVMAASLWVRLPSTASVGQALRQRSLSGHLLARVFIAASSSTAFFLLPFLLQRVKGQSPSEMGAILTLFSLAMAVAAPFGGFAADRVGARFALVVASGLSIAGGFLVLPLDSGWDILEIGMRLGVFGLGIGLLGAPNQSAIIAASPALLIGTVSALSSLARNLGIALGPAIATTLWIERQFSVEAMRPAFALLVVLPILALVAVLATLNKSSGEP
jgi:MFS family permease